MTDISRRNAVLGAAAAVTATSLATSASASQPHMDAAISYLNSARKELEAASHDKGGHRVKAIDLINQAVQQVKLGKQSAAS